MVAKAAKVLTLTVAASKRVLDEQLSQELALQLPLACWLLSKAFYGKRRKVLFVVKRVSD